MKNLKVDLTSNEAKTIKALIDSMYAEYMFSDVDIHDLKEMTGIPTKKLRGSVSSLVKKKLITTSIENDCIILYLTELVSGYVEEWKEEANQPVELFCNGLVLFKN